MQVTINGVKKEFNPGMRIVELVDDPEKNILLCLVDGQLRDLNVKLSANFDGSTIETLGIDTYSGARAYESTLRYVVAMAFKRLYPECQIKFTYFVSRSILCEIVNGHIPSSIMFKEIVREVERIIDADIPFNRVRITVDEAKKIYEDLNMPEKLVMLPYKPESYVHLYECEGYYNYLHFYMLPSTGYLKKYSIHQFSPGLILQYPRSELNGEIPEFYEESMYGKTIKKASTWCNTINCQTVADYNHWIEQNPNDFIQMCEMKHSNMLAELGQMIKNDIDNIRLIAISGPSSSGKTTFANRLRLELMSLGINPVTISLDNYYFTKPEICKIQNRPLNDLDLEHINTLDVDLLNQNLFDLINGDEVQLPKFDFTTGLRVEGDTIKVAKNQPIIIEGIHALNEALTGSIPKYQKFKIFISPQSQVHADLYTPISTTDLRLVRRIVRDRQFRNCPAKDTILMWDSVRSGEFKWIYPFQEEADYVYNSELSYEFGILRKYALQELNEIPLDDPSYLVANRLIRFLKYFKPVEDENVIPCNSLIREFIGGSCFKV